MAMIITAADRNALIRLASILPLGNPERRAILASIITARTWDGDQPYNKPFAIDNTSCYKKDKAMATLGAKAPQDRGLVTGCIMSTAVRTRASLDHLHEKSTTRSTVKNT